MIRLPPMLTPETPLKVRHLKTGDMAFIVGQTQEGDCLMAGRYPGGPSDHCWTFPQSVITSEYEEAPRGMHGFRSPP